MKYFIKHFLFNFNILMLRITRTINDKSDFLHIDTILLEIINRIDVDRPVSSTLIDVDSGWECIDNLHLNFSFKCSYMFPDQSIFIKVCSTLLKPGNFSKKIFSLYKCIVSEIFKMNIVR